MLLTPGNPVPLLPDILPPVHLPTRYHAWYSPKVPDVTSRIWKQFLAFQTSHRSRDSDASLKVTFSATGTQPRFHQAVQRHPWLAVRRPWSWSILQLARTKAEGLKLGLHSSSYPTHGSSSILAPKQHSSFNSQLRVGTSSKVSLFLPSWGVYLGGQCCIWASLCRWGQVRCTLT